MSNQGLDVGTNMLVAGSMNAEGIPTFKMERDAFFRIVPKSDVNRQAIMGSLTKSESNFIEDDYDLIVVGEDALRIAMERNSTTLRPMSRGVISPQEKSNLPMLKLLLKSLVGEGNGEDKLIYSVPARPVDGSFDIVYHTEILNMFFREIGYKPTPINEAFAIALSELIDEGLSGITISTGAGMCNVAVIHQGDQIIEFSTTNSGDYIDRSVAQALDISPSLVQLEKEAGTDLNNPTNKIMEAVAMYYKTMINYTVKTIAYELKQQEKSLPLFRDAVPVIVSGGLTLADGFTEMFSEALNNVSLPMKVGSVRRAESPMTCVAGGCLLASQL